MKRLKFIIPIVILLVSMFAFSIPAMAAAPTNVSITWNGGGSVGGTVNTGDTTSTFLVSAGLANGSFTATDSNNNPYGYNVDSNTAYITGTLTNGSMAFQTVRNTSYVPMYGVAGQSVYAYVGSSGTGAMATGSSTNYASMVNGTYGLTHTANGYNFEADASGGSYQITQTISSPNALAWFNSLGSGTSKINDMTTQASGANSVDLGWGAGCYTNANALFTGAGSFETYAQGQNGITTPISGASGSMVAGGWAASGVSSLDTILNFTNGGSIGNYSIKVH